MAHYQAFKWEELLHDGSWAAAAHGQALNTSIEKVEDNP